MNVLYGNTYTALFMPLVTYFFYLGQMIPSTAGARNYIIDFAAGWS